MNKVFIFKYYWYDTIDRGIRVNRHHGLVEINTKARLRNVDDVFFFFCQTMDTSLLYINSFIQKGSFYSRLVIHSEN